MEAFIAKHLTEILFSILTAGLLAFCRHLHSQNKKLKEYQKEDQNRKYREMIINEIEPIQDELARLHAEIESIEKCEEKDYDDLKACSKSEHERMYKDLEKVAEESRRNFKLIINSYKFRLIQLCKTHIKDGYISSADFEQITEMYKLYNGLGGNGQAQEYYDRVIVLPIKDEE